MKTTEYFSSASRPISQIQFCIDEANEKKKEFLKTHRSKILRVEAEDLKMLSGGKEGYALVVIQLSFYPIE